MEKRTQSVSRLPQELTTYVRALDHRSLVTVEGDLDLHAAPELRGTLSALAHRGHDHLLLDLDGVTFVDSIGLGVLVAALKRLRGMNGELELVCRDARTLRLLRITQLDETFTVHGSVEDALAS